MKLAILLFIWAGLMSAAEPKLIFTKVFPGSVPAYAYVGIDRSGAIEYKEASDDQHPVTAKMKEADAAPLFDLAERLNYFKDPLESNLQVANTGKKTFRYEDGTGRDSETTFNYSVNLNAQQLLDRFEQIAASERAYIDLDRTVHFDKLGVNDSLALVESLWLRKQLAAPEQFMPLLDRIIKHDTYMHLVRDRAARLKDEFLAPPPAAVAQNK